ncbi:hypothetical protein [Thiorhodococcus fuscus]|uniref:Tetratricopeptide repeat protein n=1 Tax=Thiorhodococcus fuscus TaxID=527200 RepID=A0ABW4YAH8_9GAMM
MPTEAVRGSGRRQWTAADTLAGLGVALIAAILLRSAGGALFADLQRIPPNRFFVAQEERLQSPDDAGRSLMKGIELYRRATKEMLGPQEQRQLGLLLLLEGKRTTEDRDPADRETAANAAIAALTTSLHRAPVQPRTWTYLADVALTYRASPKDALRALKESYRMAAVDPNLVLYRFELATRLRGYWDTELLRLIRPDIIALFPEQGWSPKRNAFIKRIKANPELKPLVAAILRPDPGALERLQKAINPPKKR